eukprot:TRINITY_DN5820_c0_g1_i2.p1 TRINITY_DN5820_c0_g1~~TRINITY_DN5820_c0_g1_i2.p1  ORF type:complete len:397 (+),score=-60.41 TRINITY_DN5820_c0_g1_i2:144-1334(+)
MDTDIPVYTKNADERVEPASTTKIMTYIVAVENCKDLDGTMVTVTQEVTDQLKGTESSLSNIKNGETLSMYELLNCMMVPSGNDAAMVIANYIGGGKVNSFVDMMNKKAEELGCQNTKYANPDGLHDQNHYTTAAEMYKIAKHATGLPRFMDICSQVSHTIPATNMQPKRTLYTTNSMMISTQPEYYKYTKGIKTGWHDQAGRCIVSTAAADGYRYLCVCMGAKDKDASGVRYKENKAMLDTRSLYRWALSTFQLKQIITANYPVTEVKVDLAWGKDSVLLTPEKDVSFMLPKDVNVSSITINNLQIPDTISAPITKGQVVGTATLSYANQNLTTINLVSDEDISRNGFLYFTQAVKNIVTSPWIIVIIGVFLLILVSYIFISLSLIHICRCRRRG